MKKERYAKGPGLLGPKAFDKWREWRKARDRAIENPRRLKTIMDDVKEKRSTAASSEKQP